VEELKNARAQIPTIKYDPRFWKMQKEERGELIHAMIMFVDGTLAFQRNIILLDSILRSDAEYKGPAEAIGLLSLIWTRIETALSVKLLDDQERKAIKELLASHTNTH
jgi:hypothetical protein